jgi:hypothetical protein
MRREPEEAYADTWASNDPVTNRYDPEETGSVIVIRRKADDKRFTKVYVLTGPRKGVKTWAHQDFVLGVGPHLRRCGECAQPFRSDRPDADFCPACATHHRPAYDREPFRSHGLKARGKATPYPPPPPGPPMDPIVEAPHDPECFCEACAKVVTDAVLAAHEKRAE